MNNNIDQAKVAKINGDILTIVNIASELNWDPIREQSISRILYLSSVLFSFRYENKDNPFAYDYNFSVDASGPFYSLITNSIVFLETNRYITRRNRNEISIGANKGVDLSTLPNYNEKSEWLKTIFYIIGIYGESKIYEFIIRDPQYQENVHTNAIKPINIGPDNSTVITLRSFKRTFEEELGQDASQIDDKEYLELYFEYVFSKIIKGDVEL
ncbi:MAG: hypothetical protein EOO43_00820 [Flavobacterium sp.]|nr:MAG: hypothetical protein EOO43_00820 [Flavobacterium sp.]